ncbi:hypothetical protein GSI_14856 [Ganoderma sinense ZZ0214-1]|uniref:Uncharacterized protein n=1 Tax=Ganoderma sinense ZZ0214-1 TaxID=1077348 RepID=A0A2G8RPW5_9APHY|nr:hypothetical protein GSI_14856 [Ganoderma sinense ZZ0214-1]
MWLLHTKTLELKFYKDSKRVRYAALCHVWEADDHCQPFREIQAIYSRCLASGEDPRELVTAKVRNFLDLAERDGYKWGWLDTACIDKTSSAELSEAINSMYRWYCDADVCYASLSDVADDDSPLLPESDFRSSRWHTRGWTLQELIAPHTVVFLSKSWDFIGTKASLAGVLEEITGVDLPLLASPIPPESSTISIARRMSRASRRETTRPEDRAYSLMGIFGVTMPIIYGEGGERSFERLQVEIIKMRPYDQTIFAWGPIHPNIDTALANLRCPRSLEYPVLCIPEDPCSRLLAPSPGEFSSSSNFEPIEPERRGFDCVTFPHTPR